MILGLPIETWFGLTVLGAIISTAGTLLGTVLKEYFFIRSFEKWKQKKILEQLYQRYRDPLFLSALDLSIRLSEINYHYPTTYLKNKVLESNPESQIDNSLLDPYFQKHKLLSTCYRLAAFLGWLELYRQEITYLRSGNNKHSESLDNAVKSIRIALADGQINREDDWTEWRDTLIFRDELRAIGEAMIDTKGDTKKIIGYGSFIETIEGGDKCSINRWSPVVFNFLLDLEPGGKDFRRKRIQLLFVHLVDLMKLLGASPIDDWIIKERNQLMVELKRAKVILNQHGS